MARLPRSAVSRLALVAIDVIEGACHAADHGPVDRTELHKLALGYLMLAGLANQHQATVFWQVLGQEGVFEQLSCRQSHYGIMLHGMRQRAEAMAV